MLYLTSICVCDVCVMSWWFKLRLSNVSLKYDRLKNYCRNLLETLNWYEEHISRSGRPNSLPSVYISTLPSVYIYSLPSVYILISVRAYLLTSVCIYLLTSVRVYILTSVRVYLHTSVRASVRWLEDEVRQMSVQMGESITYASARSDSKLANFYRIQELKVCGLCIDISRCVCVCD